ncbi:hypothetical protein QWY28_17805 [Nocardioides sp. SOB77]|uniref:DksA C4-type domain-containing protein n=1 Tax=Nocardioides oceani TaxID=3058369 RepID=A0ABT8FL05_9ACTN|nr:hypothetical protein [Nocardioides oceani]MDN4174822.1 hypothetical protein [Nocardioides oceani]
MPVLPTRPDPSAGVTPGRPGRLPPADPDEPRVRDAHRASVRRTPDRIHQALDRTDAGACGECTACGRLVALLDLRRCPWLERCDACSLSSV